MRRKTFFLPIFMFMMAMLSFGASDVLAGPFSEIVVFGDSLSDNGNLLLTNYQPKPDPEEYWQGRLSNGPVWVEYLTNASHFNTNLYDLALGGAKSEGLVPPGLVEQVQGYTIATKPPLPTANLYVIWIGGNDFLNGSGDFQSVVANINKAMELLATSGAKAMLVMNLPDLGAIPDTLGTSEAPQATAYAVNFNSNLASMIDAFSTAHPDIQLYEFDSFAFFQEVRSNPGGFGFVNVTQPSPNFGIPNNFDGAGYLFWDKIHPTTAMHALIADRVYESINAQIPATAPATSAQTSDSGSSSSCFIATLLL